jgi:hypothetical protein
MVKNGVFSKVFSLIALGPLYNRPGLPSDQLEQIQHFSPLPSTLLLYYIKS